MSRRREAVRRELLPDPVFGKVVIARFVNQVMRNGKKSIAEQIVYSALDVIKKEIKSAKEVDFFEQALDKIRPLVEVKSRRVGGATYQVPIEVRPGRAEALGMRWLIDAARKRREKSMGLRLAKEILDASEGRGMAIKKREDVHRMAEANKAFSHYRW